MIWPFKKRKPKPRDHDLYIFDPLEDLTAQELARINFGLVFGAEEFPRFDRGYTPVAHFANLYGAPEIGRHFRFMPEKAA